MVSQSISSHQASQRFRLDSLLQGIPEYTMSDEMNLAEIREVNLTYLMLAQRLIRQDKVEAMFRLGMSEDAADMLNTLSAAQILKLAAGNMLLCRFRVDDDLVWSLLTNQSVRKVDNDATSRLHASILMAGRVAEIL
jgi:flagellar transcriptional activator FlhD